MVGPLPPVDAAWAPHEEAFHDVARVVRLSTGFVLVPVAVPGPDLARALGGWLSSAGHPVETWELLGDAEWERLAWFLLSRSPPREGVVMVIGSRIPPQGASQALGLVNQARDAIVKKIGRPVLWCGPRSFLNFTWEEAPDFWSIRSVDHSMDAAPPAPALAPVGPAPAPAHAAPPPPAAPRDTPEREARTAREAEQKNTLVHEALAQGDSMSAAILAAKEAESALASGRADAALRVIEAPMLLGEAVPAELRQRLGVLRARALHASGREGEAVRELDTLLATGQLSPAVEMEALSERAQLAAEAGDADQAESLFTQAQARAREVGSFEGDLQARVGLAEAALSRGQVDKARLVILPEGDGDARWLERMYQGGGPLVIAPRITALERRARSALARAAQQSYDAGAARRIDGTPPLDEALLRRVHGAAVSAGLASSRVALLAGISHAFVASLPTAASPGEQLLLDLHHLNDVDRLLNGQQPIASWLQNAALLAGPRREAAVFREALERIRRPARSAGTDGAPPPAPPSGERGAAPAALAATAPAAPRSGERGAAPAADSSSEIEAPLCVLLHAREDQAAARSLRRHVTPLLRAGRMRWWSPEQIAPGELVAQITEQRIREASLLLVLISAAFLASDDGLQSVEKALAMDKRVVPIPLRPTAWMDTALAGIAPLPPDGKPISTRRDQDTAWTEVVEGIRSLLEQIREARSPT